MKKLRYMIDCHKWFVRKSQHYVLGNWHIYFKEEARTSPTKRKMLIDFYKQYPIAWFRFMRSCWNDYKSK